MSEANGRRRVWEGVNPEQDARVLAAFAKATGKPLGGKPARKAPDRWAALNEFVDVRMRDLHASELAVWFVLFRDTRNGVARTGMTDIATRTGMTRRGVVKALGGLREKGLVELVKKGSVGGTPNTYRVNGSGSNLGNRGSLP